MFGMVTIEDVWNVVNIGKDRGSDCFLEGPVKRFIDTYNARPSFFTPYKDGKEFFGGLLAHVAYPAALSIFAGFSTLFVALGLAIGVGCMVTSVGAAILGSYEFCDESIENAATAFHIAGLALLAIATSTLLMVVSIFHTPLTFLTRSGASLVTSISGCIEKLSVEQDQKNNKEGYEMNIYNQTY